MVAASNARTAGWAFILRNIYRPGLLSGQFNGLVSNPPWLGVGAHECSVGGTVPPLPYRSRAITRADRGRSVREKHSQYSRSLNHAHLISKSTSVPTLIEQIQLVRRFLREVLKGSVLKQA
jgi:hypothetical protein